ncbi:CBS domain-containing protein [Sulfurimonas sp.]|uniref:CBS domain-containing protein n=1 Tax=Sulfurimonas sp. TaxID=2022749 RepID=UPI002AAF255C|nr:CBS domain-containing protein [Sulfurimonas sp.]
MSILDQRKLVESIRPFDTLNSNELDNLMTKIDIAYYPIGTLLMSKKLPSIAFYIIIKGCVTEYIDDEVHNVYSPGDSFDADALIYSKCEGKFVVDNDLICYEIQKYDFLELMQCKKVQSYFLQDLVTRHNNSKDDYLSLKVSDIVSYKVCMTEKDRTIYEALVKQKEIVSIDADDFLFNALLIMVNNATNRVVVTKDGKIVDILEQLDLLSYFSNNSHVGA